MKLARQGGALVESPRRRSSGGAQRAALLVVGLAVAGTAAVAEGSPVVTEASRLTTAIGDLGGRALAIDGDALACGSRFDSTSGLHDGSVYVFERVRGAWRQAARLTAGDGSDGALLGASVDVSGRTVVAGAPFDDSFAINAGAAHVFVGEAGAPWIEVAMLVGSDPVPFRDFGRSVTVDGDRLAVGAPGIDGRTGQVSVFQRTEAGWSETEVLRAPEPAVFDDYGQAVAVDAGTLVVGSPGDEGAALNTGTAYVYEWDGLGWALAAELLPDPAPDSAGFGAALALDGDTIVVGAEEGAGGSGSVYVFGRDVGGSGAWGRIQRLAASDGGSGQGFGGAVTVAGDRVLVGARDFSRSEPVVGRAYLFAPPLPGGAELEEVARLAPSEPKGFLALGSAVALDADTAYVGVPDESVEGGPGAVYLYPFADCLVGLELAGDRVAAGDSLPFRVTVLHRRPRTVTVPWVAWAEDARGRVVAEERLGPVTFRLGDRRTLAGVLVLPRSLPPGELRVLVGVSGMRQGVAWAERTIAVVPAGPSARRPVEGRGTGATPW